MFEDIVSIFEKIIMPLLLILTSWSVVTFITIMSFYPALSKILHRIANRSGHRGRGREDL